MTKAKTIDATPDSPERGEALVTRAAANAYELIMQAVADPACDPAKLRELLAVRREWNDDEARAEFNAAVVRFQQGCKTIAKADSANGKAYARMDRIWNSIRPLMEQCGLAVSWESCRPIDGICHLDGHLRHARGHAEPLHYELPMPEAIKTRDGRNVQNVAQAMGSATTYAKRYATCAALGIQTGEDNDGNGGQADGISALQAQEIGALLAEAETDYGEQGGEVVAAFWKSMDKYGLGSVAELDAKRGGASLIWLRGELRKLRGAENE